LTYQIIYVVFFTYHGFLTITSSSRIISRDTANLSLLLNCRPRQHFCLARHYDTRYDTSVVTSLRENYYLYGNILKAFAKKRSSFTWRSNEAGKTFKRGHIHRVGSGTSINIWEDHLIPNSYNRLVMTMWGRIMLSSINDFINPITREWDSNKRKFLPD
jgi:hypothetical protein